MSEVYHHQALPEGTILREWRLGRVLGAGGFGIVYQGRGVYFDEQVAIKEYFPGAISNRQDGATVRPTNSSSVDVYDLGLKKFVEEAKVLWSLSQPERHPNIVGVRSLFEIHGTAYMVMDFESGAPLSQMLREGRRFDEAWLLTMLRSIAGGLDRAHRAGVIHRDIKPANILIDEAGRPVLIDFGSARFEAGQATSTGVTFYTPPYAALEQYVKAYPQGPWTDIYALGVTLYQCVSGEKPADVLERMHGEVGEALCARDRPGFSRAFARAVDAAMAVRPADRPQSMPEWLRLFELGDPPEGGEDDSTRVAVTASETVTQTPPPAAPLPLPDKPSIAVLPFADPSGAVEGDYFADGMVDEIVGALTRFQSLFVIASGSSLSYRERERDFKRIGRELGVRFLLEGSVRRSGQRVRIAVDLVEAEAGVKIWSERFEGVLDDVFALQDEVANAVAARIEPTIHAADLRRGAARPTEDLGAYDLFLRAQQLYREFDNSGVQAAIALFDEAVARDPTFIGAWALLAYMHTRTLAFGWAADREATAHKAQDAISHILLANDDDADALGCAAFAKAVLGGDRRTSMAMADRALTLNPGSSLCRVLTGYVSLLSDQYEQAHERFQYALRLNPRSPERYLALVGVGSSLVCLERYEEAVPWLDEVITARPNYPTPLFNLAIALTYLGRIEEAKAVLARFELLASLKSWIDTVVVTRGWSETFLTGLRRLGVDV